MGEVFEGWQDVLERRVAIKLLRPELTQNRAAVARFVREARTTCRLSHPNVVTVIDVGETTDGRRFLVMELLEGQTLTELMQERGRLALGEALDIAQQVVRGMAAGQGVGLVHRDLKPDNIFILPGGHVKILDFGLATLLDPEDEVGPEDADAASAGRPAPSNPTFSPEVEAVLGDDTMPTESVSEAPASLSPGLLALERRSNPRLTRPGALMGTPRYMAPEQALRWRVDHRSDLYSFGCLFYEMLSGAMPLPGPGPREFMRQHIHEAPVPLARVAPELPPGLVEIMHRLLEKDPDDRFADWSSLSESLRALGDTGSLDEPPPVTEEAPLPPGEPYRFLQPFSAATRELFFGRDGDLTRFRAAWEHVERPPMLLLSGASGVGKTSFLLARVLPHLRDTGHRVLRVRGGAAPFSLLQQMVQRSLARDPSESDGSADLPMAELVDQLASLSGRPVAIVLDQLEELFTMGGEEEVEVFQANLAALLAGGEVRARVILSIREDYLGSLIRALHPLPVDEWSRTLALRPLEREDIRAALLGPCNPASPVSYGRFSYEAGLVDEIVEDLLRDEAGEVAPRIQAVGARLWEMVRQRDPPLIRRSDYRERLGGARGIISRVLDDAIADQDLEDQGVAKELLRALSHLPGSATSRPAPESELVGASRDQERRQRVLRRLEDRWRVVQGYTDPRWPGERTYRIAHEALINRIQQYGEEGSERDRARQLFQHGFSLWVQGGKREGDLLPEPHFEEVLQHIEDLVLRSEDERTFFAESRRRHNEGWERRYREARNARYRQRLLLTLYPASLILLGLVLGQVPVEFSSFKRGYAWVLSHARVSGASLAGFDLSDLDLRGARLRGARLEDSRLQNTRLDEADLQQAVLDRAQAENAVLDGANLQRASLVGTSLSGASLVNADLRGSRLDGAKLAGADLTLARFDLTTSWPEGGPPEGAVGPQGRAPELVAPGADLRGLDLFQLEAPGADLRAADLRGSSLVEASLARANLDAALLSEARLGRAELFEASLVGADLRAADLRKADLAFADLKGARLEQANLAGAILRGADLCGADLSRATLLSANLEEAVACPSTSWPGGEAPEGVQLVVDVTLDETLPKEP